MTYFYVALGGALGSVARYMMVSASGRMMGMAFPYGTLFVNILGSFLMGILIGTLARLLPENQSQIHAFLAVGVLGGFTTFSAFSLDTVTLMENGQGAQALLYVLASVVLSILALFAGLYALRMLPA